MAPPNPLNRALILALSLTSSIIALILVGYFLDQRHHTQVWIIVGLAVGMIYGAYEVWKFLAEQNNGTR